MNWTVVAIVGIICWMIVSTSKNGKSFSKKEKLFSDRMDQEQHRIEQQLQEMSERIAVLEKIVTDEKYDLKKEFDNLKD